MSTERISVPVAEPLRTAIREHPEEFGVEQFRSESARIQQLVKAGAQAMRKHVEDARMVAAYTEWADDHERRDAVAALADEALGAGGFVDDLLNSGASGRRR